MEPIKQELTRETFKYEENLLIVSKNDLIITGLPDGVKIPNYGCISSRLMHFWLWFIWNYQYTANPLVTSDTSEIPQEFQKPEFLGRSIVTKQLEEVPFEFHIHYFVSESALKVDQQNENIWKGKLQGLNLYDNLESPHMYVTEKDETGKDVYLELDDLHQKLKVPGLAEMMVSTATYIYLAAMEYARFKGIIIANALIKFGFDSEGFFMVSNEILTPNTSDMWYLTHETKEVRNIFSLSDWIKENTKSDGTIPQIPEDIIQKTSQEYTELSRRLTGLA